ncbi:MAG: hypothetical protein KGL93_05905 [Gemmatimonadota bacterium]|nr:hypothetical protein [Gemmatimonadota bacterium]HEU4990096.1 hypothetical protein [Gemmatimonadaceae bacterium]
MRALWRVVLLVLAAAAPLWAQRDPAVRVDLVRAAGQPDVPAVSVSHALDDPQLQELMRNGFAVALHFRLELWRTGGVFNDLESATQWDVKVQYNLDPYGKAYNIVRHHGNQIEDFGAIRSLDSTEALLARPYRVLLPPRHPHAKYYYNVVLEVEALNANDLSELQRWLHGDLQPAVRGKTNPLSALKNGVGRLLSRMLGGTKRSYEATSPTFVADGG